MVNSIELSNHRLVADTLNTFRSSPNEQIWDTVILSFRFIPQRCRIQEYFYLVKPLKSCIKPQLVAYDVKYDKYWFRQVFLIALSFRTDYRYRTKNSRLALNLE